ncbi:MAG TPA: hypothetical protein VNG94_07340, partial [Pyrinomonadaceae bacterium]|nr:hypothetical protein [Pyrinomonadaceae bacterium]
FFDMQIDAVQCYSRAERLAKTACFYRCHNVTAPLFPFRDALSANVSLRQTICLAPTVPCSDEPGATPQEFESSDNEALKARFSAKMNRAFSADAILLHKSWSLARGWQ